VSNLRNVTSDVLKHIIQYSNTKKLCLLIMQWQRRHGKK